jgi:hypothetical protein
MVLSLPPHERLRRWEDTMAKIIGSASVCYACMIVDQLAEMPDDHPATEPEPWCMVGSRSSSWVMGVECTCEPHVTRMSNFGTALYCDTEDNAYCNYECTCGAADDDASDLGFRVASRCDACGTYQGGNRYAYVILDC